MAILRFEEPKLVEELKRLPVELRVAFAAACAERQMPSYRLFHRQTGEGDAGQLERILDGLWSDPHGAKANRSELQHELDRCMRLIPQEDGISMPWTELATYAQDAGMSVAYALRARLSGDPKEPGWAARVGYEALDHFVINRGNIDTNMPGAEEQGIAHHLVQAELLRQQRDLQELLYAAGESDTSSVVARLHSRSKAESAIFFGLVKSPPKE